MRLHELKCWPRFFEDVAEGRKMFEIRRNDRDFRVGDELHLLEWDPALARYTGRRCEVRVVYLVEGAPFLPEGTCVMGIER